MCRTHLLLLSLGLLFHQGAQCQHGVIREYAALAPKPDASPLAPLFEEPLTDTSITLGPDKAYYLTGSAASADEPVYAKRVRIWRSTDMRHWKVIRTIDFGTAAVRSPEIHYLKGRFWLTAGVEGGGTDLVGFEGTGLATSQIKRVRVTARGEDPLLFLDDDGTFYWIMGAGEVARMKPDPMDGLAAEPKPVIAPIRGALLRSSGMHGAFLAKIDGFYHLFVAERQLSHGNLGRTGLPGGTDDTFVAVSSRPDAGYGEKRYLAFPHAGQTTLFRDAKGELWATFSCTDTRGIFRLRPGAFRVEKVDASKPVWAIGFDFDRPDQPSKYQPQAMMLRPDTAHIYEGGVGFIKPIPMDPVPGQRAAFPWIRDTSIICGPDGKYYMTGTSGNMDAIHLWRSPDLKRFEYLQPAFTLDRSNPELWYNNGQNPFLWAPEIHYFNGTYWIPWCVSQKLGVGLLKSGTGRPEGPYAPSYQGNRPLVGAYIDASLFRDDDGTPYFLWQGRFLRKMTKDLSGFDGGTVELMTVDGEQVGYEGIFLCKIGPWYVLTAAEWDGGGNREDGTYDMMYSVSRKIAGPYTARRVGVPHGGHSTMFQDKNGQWCLSFFGNDRTAPFRAMPGVAPLSIQDTGSGLIVRPAVHR